MHLIDRDRRIDRVQSRPRVGPGAIVMHPRQAPQHRGIPWRMFRAEADRIRAELSERAARREASVSAYRLLHVLGTLVPAPREILRNEKE